MSADGRQIAIDSPGGGGLWFYSVEARTYHRIASVTGGPLPNPRWLSDSRRLVCSSRDRLWLADALSGQSRELLAISGETLTRPIVTSQDSQLFFARGTITGDIWLMRFGEGKK